LRGFDVLTRRELGGLNIRLSADGSRAVRAFLASRLDEAAGVRAAELTKANAAQHSPRLHAVTVVRTGLSSPGLE
jgi:hypothetical protein